MSPNGVVLLTLRIGTDKIGHHETRYGSFGGASEVRAPYGMMDRVNAAKPKAPPRRPGRWWYAAAVAIFAVSLVPAVVIGLSLADQVSSYGITPIDNDETITIGGKQKAIYIDESLVGGAPVRAECALNPANGGTRIFTVRPVGDLQVDRWQRIARTPEGTPPGSYVLRCRGVGNATLGISNNPEIATGLFQAFLVLAFPIGGAMIAVLITVIVAVLRHRAPTSPPPNASQPSRSR